MRLIGQEIGEYLFSWYMIWALIVISCSVCTPQVVLGENSGVTEWRFSEFQWENDDVFPHPSKEPGDRFYTNGLRFTWAKHFPPEAKFRVDELPSWARVSAKAICRNDPCVADVEAGIGQNFYTPERIDIAAPQPNDRPWAGWLYGHMSLGISKRLASRHRFELQIGATGEASLAEEVQTGWHRLIDTTTPRGWDNQFDTAIGANLFYEYQYRSCREKVHGFGFDAVPTFTAATGTIMTYVGAGFELRFGRHISGFPYRPVPSVAAMAEEPEAAAAMCLTTPECRPKWEYYVFIGGEGRGIVHNYFLEGSLFRDEFGAVSPERFVWDFRYGFSVRRESWRVTYAMIRRGPEFNRSAGTDNGIHNYVSFSVSREFQ